ncbi:MAG TPA: hypothetical protein VNO35_21625 [Steroidobacteraceae bacterium]|nr:hypothetical protein [Steroidobacteraceae bacterium]
MNTTANGLSRADASIQEFLSHMRDLLDALNEEGVEATTALRERIAVSIDAVQPRLERLRESVADTAGSVDEVVHDHPWGAVVAGAAVGVAVGCIAAAGAIRFLPESDFASKAARYGHGVVRRYRPYVRRARKLADNYWPF